MDIDALIRECIVNNNAKRWAAFFALTERYIRKAAHHTLNKFTQSVHAHIDIDDIVQEVFMRLLKNNRKALLSYDPSKSAFQTWLNKITANTTVDLLRQETRRNKKKQEETSLHPDCLYNLLRDELMDAIQRNLTEQEYAIFMGYYVSDKPDTEIAEELGITVPTARWHRSNIRKKIKLSL